LHFELSSRLDEIAPVLEAVEAVLAQHDFSAADLFAVRLALHEALRNAICRGNGLDPVKKVLVYCRIDRERFEALITHECTRWGPAALAAPGSMPPADLGLSLMRYYIDELAFPQPGNTLAMIHRRHAGPAPTL
jgi:anti-sigma regulatory factor (Ser/Thr protein kinase)